MTFKRMMYDVSAHAIAHVFGSGFNLQFYLVSLFIKLKKGLFSVSTELTVTAHSDEKVK